MKGSSLGAGLRARVAALFAAAFIIGAMISFGIVSLASMAVRVTDLPVEGRAQVVVAGLVVLALVDLMAIRKARYCPLGLRRQTPRSLRTRYPVAFVVAVWGFDTGLAVTTFRVAAITWGALLMAAVGLSSRWVGLGYGLGFVLPLLALIFTQGPRDPSNRRDSVGASLQALLGKRATLQAGSALVLWIAAALLLTCLAAR